MPKYITHGLVHKKDQKKEEEKTRLDYSILLRVLSPRHIIGDAQMKPCSVTDCALMRD